MDTLNNVELAARSLAAARADAEEAASVVSRVEEAILSSIPQELLARKEEATTQRQVALDAVRAAEERLRIATLEHWTATGEKKLPFGIEVHERRNVSYDAASALNWAIEHKLFLALDAKGFEKAVLASPAQFEGVATVCVAGQARIPTNLVVEAK